MVDFEFKWLQISDLHEGIKLQNWLWPTFKHSLFEDLKKVHASVGSWNVVIFSGDLTQQGAREEFDRLDKTLSELWECFDKLGFSPSLFAIPGNHDLVRPSATQPEVLLLNRWWEVDAVRGQLLASSAPYLKTIQEAFREFSAWNDRLKSGCIPVVTSGCGLLPGDCSTVIPVGAGQVGIIGLNSAWLQLGEGNYERKLHIHPDQMLALTNEDPVAWCKRNTFNIVVTHHPVSWLHPDSEVYWDGEINPPGRFDAHLFGHMHTPQAATIALGGSPARTLLQAPSLFGLEYLGDKVSRRTHGYSVGRYQMDGGVCELRIWPRRLRTLAAGNKKLGPDMDFDLDETNSFVAVMRSADSTSSNGDSRKLPEEASVRVLPLTAQSNEVLGKARYHLPPAKAHQNVRRIEQQKCLASLSESHVVWIISEWGMGADGFVSCIQRNRNHADVPTFRLDLSQYVTREQFFDAVNQALGCSIERFCELLSNAGPAYLLLDDFPSNAVVMEGHSPPERDLEQWVAAITEYCPELSIFIRARLAPAIHEYLVVELKPLDEADLKTYLAEHERGGTQVSSPDAVGILYRHTDGIPIRVDNSLKDLEVVALSELVNSESDLSAKSVAISEVAPALAHVVQDVADATDPALRRSFDLLKALSIFPQGEQLNRIRRFNGAHAFYPVHARELLDKALIDASTVQDINVAGADSPTKRLLVPRPVRDCIREKINRSELAKLNRKAADLYFGSEWATGHIKHASFEDPHGSASEIANASTIIIRLLRDTDTPASVQRIPPVLRLASSFVAALIKGHHYRSVVTFGEELLRLIPEGGFEEQREYLRYQFARSLRMVGDHARSKGILLEIRNANFSNNTRQSIFLNLALCHESLDEISEAIAAARDVVKIDKNTAHALQAQSIILENSRDDPDRLQKLVSLEALCRKKKAFVAANNIALLRAREAEADGDLARVREILANLVGTADTAEDYYNETRAVIQLAELMVEAGHSLGAADQLRLIRSYHFVFNERMSTLFDRCHDALWSNFTINNDTANLLSLFRHSSLFWRLRGQDEREKDYLRQLAKLVGSALPQDIRRLDREAAYYWVRASSAILEMPA